MGGERTFDEFDDPVSSGSETTPLSGLRKIPDASELTPEDCYSIAVHGAHAWLRARDTRNWDDVVEKAVALAVSGVPVSRIPVLLDVPAADFEANIDVEKISAFLNSEVAKRIYERALAGDKTMLALVAKERLGWGKTSVVEHTGTIQIQPVLNISLLSEAEERALRGKALPEPSVIEVVPPDGRSGRRGSGA